MNPEPRFQSDDERFARLLGAIDRDAPPPDVDALEALRRRAAEAFAATSAGPSAGPSAASPSDSADLPASDRHDRSSSVPPAPASVPAALPTAGPDRPRPPEPRLMSSLAFRVVLAAAASLAAIAGWFQLPGPRADAESATFGEVLAELQRADTLQMRLDKDGRRVDVWVRTPGLVRREESPTRYDIAIGSRLWQIDESADTQTEGDSPWYVDPRRPIDLLALLDVGLDAARRSHLESTSALLQARPVRRGLYDDRPAIVYDVELPIGRTDANSPAAPPDSTRTIAVEAFVDARTLQLLALRAWPGSTPLAERRRPLAELRLLAINAPIDAKKFEVTKSLQDDGRLGEVSAAQGVVVLRAPLAKRWTPVGPGAILRAGDWIRTETRGAHAVRVRLTSHVELTVGPGSLVELLSPLQARLHSGQLQVRVVEPLERKKDDGEKQGDGERPDKPEGSFELLGPREGRRTFARPGKSLLRVDRQAKLVDVAERPVWLEGFEGASNNESLGSLIVDLPDGGAAPLAVGYHKVQVEIRDQIARTTIEESFVNDTDRRLEGVFHFPLPSDASISGFGMWIGDELVEADVVERQRAREIYETVLREKRDPGLLEWHGGNLFKARVFPIEPRSEKRIRIVYTQVLPLQGARYRYSYGLRSELLRTRPLRELSIDLTVQSALPLKQVVCATHAVRAEQTPHAAHVEFNARDYVPDRDFEVECQIDGRQSDVVVTPHRRADDGYFLLQLTPPSPAGDWRSERLPDGAPLRLVLLCDTSASMDAEKRRLQAEFVEATLASLGPDDRFQLATADVDVQWAAAAPTAPDAENVAAAIRRLAARRSLGWTDLDRAFDAVLRKAPPSAHIVYLGDGSITAGEADAAAFVRRLTQRAVAGKPDDDPRTRRTLHAVGFGNLHDSAVLRGIAAAGGGSVRTTSGDRAPRAAALELLNEIARPGLRDLQVEFRGIRVAAVYPERPPNIPAGSQQILVGRYLPEPGVEQGEVVVTGRHGDRQVRYSAKIELAQAESGNSFIPRLWARERLDHLLAQGASAEVRDEILELSERFHIITPYTSLLVLETDEDRRRFGVRRRFEMRDGERFFAEGVAKANFELLEAEMRRSGSWRSGLRRKILRDIVRMERDPNEFDASIAELLAFLHGGTGMAHQMEGLQGPRWFSWLRDDLHANAGSGDGAGSHWGFPFRGYFGGGMVGMGGGMGGGFGGGLGGTGGGMGGMGGGTFGDASQAMEATADDTNLEFYEASNVLSDDVMDDDGGDATEDGEVDEDGSRARGVDRKELGWSADESYSSGRGLSYGGTTPPSRWRTPDLWTGGDFFRRHDIGWFDDAELFSTHDDTWRATLFPQLPSGRGPRPSQAPEPKDWTAEALEVVRGLSRRAALEAWKGGFEVVRVDERFDEFDGRRTSLHRERTLRGPSRWAARTLNPDEQTVVQYCDGDDRGAYSLQFQTGRRRASTEWERSSIPLALDDFSLVSPLEQFPSEKASVERVADSPLVVLVVVRASGQGTERYSIDSNKRAVVKHETLWKGRVERSTTFDEFVQAAGVWWATKIVSRNADGATTAASRLQVEAFAPDAFEARWKQELADKGPVWFVRDPEPAFDEARQREAEGRATSDDLLVLIAHDVELQAWGDVHRRVATLERAAAIGGAAPPGLRWLRLLLFARAGRDDELRLHTLAEARRLAQQAVPDELPLARFLVYESQSTSSPAESLELLDAIQPVVDRQPPETRAAAGQLHRRLMIARQLQHSEEAIQTAIRLADLEPWAVARQIECAKLLHSEGRYAEAIERLTQAIARTDPRHDFNRTQLHEAVCELLRHRREWSELAKFTADWAAKIDPQIGSKAAYRQWLSALVYDEREGEADALCERWLREVRAGEPLTEGRRARFEAAVDFVTDQLRQEPPELHGRRLELLWLVPLADVARSFVREGREIELARTAYNALTVRDNDVADRLRGEWFVELLDDAETASAAGLNLMVNAVSARRIWAPRPIGGRAQFDASSTPDEVWRSIAAVVRRRWEAAPQASDDRLRLSDDRLRLEETLTTIYRRRLGDEAHAEFLRRVREVATPEQREFATSQLFDMLLTVDWTDDVEGELFGLLGQLSEAPRPLDRLIGQAPGLLKLVDRALEGRVEAAERRLADVGGRDKLSRRELAVLRADAVRAERAELAERLYRASEEEQGPLSNWLALEAAWIDARDGRNLERVERIAWRLLGDRPVDREAERPLSEAEKSGQDELIWKSWFEARQRERALALVAATSVRRDAKGDRIERLLRYADQGIAAGGRAARAWREVKFDLLVALDRSDDLERTLREWIARDESTAPWRLRLGRLLAERGRLEEAAGLYEACERDGLLSGGDYRLFARWALALGRRDVHERTKSEAYRRTPEEQLEDRLEGMTNEELEAGVDSADLREDLLLTLEALFRKSRSPSRYADTLAAVYRQSRDARFARLLPDAVIGRTPQEIYPLLRDLSDSVVGGLSTEAATDEVLERVEELRKRELTAVDRRALDLLEATVRMRAAEVLDRPEPQQAACLQALRRAFEHAWSDGEPLLMIEFLAGMRDRTTETLQTERLRQMTELERRLPVGSRDWMQAVVRRGSTLRLFGRIDEGLLLLESGVGQYEQRHEGRWPYADHDVVNEYVAMLESAGRYEDAERYLVRRIERATSEAQAGRFQERLLATRVNWFRAEAKAVAPGAERGRSQRFGSLLADMEKRLAATDDEDERRKIVERWCEVLEIGRKHGIPETKAAVEDLAFRVLPEVLRRQTKAYRETAKAPLAVLGAVCGNRTTLRYVVERYEAYPRRNERTSSDPRSAFGSELSALRAATGASDLDDRILAIVIDEIRRELERGEAPDWPILNANHSEFWVDRREAFEKATEETLAERAESGRRVLAAAEYFAGGLGRRERGIEILAKARSQGVLDERSEWLLASWLRQAGRAAEAIPILVTLSKASPDRLDYRIELLDAYAAAERAVELDATLKATIEHFHGGGRWTESTIVDLARGCLNWNAEERAVEYFREAIALRQRASESGGRNDEELAGYYQDLASVLSDLGRTREAVEAATGAIVCWPSRHELREQALETLQRVVADAQDLDAFAAAWSQETVKSGRDSATVRRAIGTTYQGRDEHEKAVVQFKAALELQPEDATLHRALIETFDASGNSEAATSQLLALIEFQRRDLALFRELAGRLAGDEAEAERAATSIVESNGMEAENHAALAEYRQEQDRWGEAIFHWKRAAALRSLEPTGLLKLAAAQIHEEQWEAARQTLKQLRSTDWVEDVEAQIQELEEAIPRR